jgi:hypothetical protein
MTNYSIWPSNPTPAKLEEVDPASTNVGVRFKSSVAGYITAIRFYQANTGTFSAALWNNFGGQLGTASVVVSSGGWQQADFASPIAISADTVYVASYRAPAGSPYAADGNYFTVGVDNAPLHALADGEGGNGNGVYDYSSSLIFPAYSFEKSNYWVDVVFTETLPASSLPIQSAHRFYANLMGH